MKKLFSLFLPVPRMIKMNFKKYGVKRYECSVNGMSVKWGRKLQILHSKTSIKIYKLQPSFKHEVNNGFPNDFTEKNKFEI